MAWITLTESQVKTRLTGAELTAFKSSNLPDGLLAEDLMSEILQGVVREVRGRVAACGDNTLGSGDTIPDELEHHALAIAVYRLITRLPLSGRSSIVEQRKAAYDDALRIMQDVAACKFSIVDPVTATTETLAGQRPAYSTKTRAWKQSDQEGL